MKPVILFFILSLATGIGVSEARSPRGQRPTEIELADIRHGQPRTIEVVVYNADYKDGQWEPDTSWIAPYNRIVTRWNSEGYPQTETNCTFLLQREASSSFTRYFYHSDDYRKAFILSTSYYSDSSRPPATYRLEFGYDRHGRLKNTWLRDTAGTKIHTTRYKTDRQGCIRLDQTTDSLGQPISSTRQRCDARGGILRMKNRLYITGEKKPMVSIYRNTYENGLLQRTVLVRTRGGHTSQRGETARYAYEYDEHGTWLRRIAWTESAPDKAQIHERKIEYYD